METTRTSRQLNRLSEAFIYRSIRLGYPCEIAETLHRDLLVVKYADQGCRLHMKSKVCSHSSLNNEKVKALTREIIVDGQVDTEALVALLDSLSHFARLVYVPGSIDVSVASPTEADNLFIDGNGGLNQLTLMFLRCCDPVGHLPSYALTNFESTTCTA